MMGPIGAAAMPAKLAPQIICFAASMTEEKQTKLNKGNNEMMLFLFFPFSQ